MNEPLVLKIATYAWHNDSNDKRELGVARALGARVLVMAKGARTGERDTVDGFAVYRCSTRPLGPHVPVKLNRIAAIFTWAFQARRLHPDVITGRDLSGLVIGYLSNAFLPKRRRAKLIYDSHEYELGRDMGLRHRSSLQLALLRFLERFLMKRCVFSIAVSDPIADELQRVHHLAARPVVARNVPDNWTLDPAESGARRREFCAALGVGEETFLLMYSGFITRNRGIENMLRVVARTQNTAAVIMGYSEDDYPEELRALCETLGIGARVLFHDAVPLEILWQYIGAADVGMVIHQPVSRSLYLTIPNRFFENVQSLTPVITLDAPAVADLCEGYGIGLSVDAQSVEALTDAAERLRDDTAFYAQCKANLVRAKEDLCWEKEKTQLQEAYKKLLAAL